MLGNSAPPSQKCPFPQGNILHGKILSSNPLLLPSPHKKKSLLKTSPYFPITNIICKQWAKFIACSPSPENCGELSHPQRHIY
jgi:hypothetical protein